MLALSREDGFVGEYLLSLDEEDYICEGRIVNNLPHVLNQTVDRLVVYLIFFQLADVKDADIVQPFASVEASKDKELLCANDTSGVPLSASRCFLRFYGVAPSHGICVEHIQIIRWDNLFERAASAIITTKEINLIPNEVCCVSTETFWRGPINLGLTPSQRFGVEDM